MSPSLLQARPRADPSLARVCVVRRGGPASTTAPAAGLDPVAHERWCWILVALVVSPPPLRMPAEEPGTDANPLGHAPHFLQGQPVTATLKDGVRVTGILAAATPDAGDLSIALRQAVTILPASEGTPAPKPALVLNGKDLVQLEAQDTDIDFAALPQRPQSSASSSTPAAAAAATDSFRTDTDISRASQLGKERQLQAWGADASSYGAGGIEDGDGGLEDGLGRSVNGNNGSGKGNAGRRGGPASSSNGGGAWDQFAANERAFGLRTDYDDEIYTTRLDRSTADFKQREARAAQLEREILKGSTSSTSLAYNAHVAEERGEQVADSLDEEERYGAVIRTGTEGAYVPPGARKAALARLQQQQQNGGQGQGSPGGAGSGSSGTASPAPPPPPVSSLSASTPAAAAAPAALTTSPTPTTTKPNPNAKPYDRSMQEFVHSERVRLEQRRAQMQQAQQQSQQQAQLKKEHDSKLASLVQWSQTFKNPYPMPDEVAQILGKKPAGDSKTTATKSATVSPATATTALPPATSAAIVASPKASAAAAGKPTAPTTTTKITKAMVLEIPPFDPNRAKAKQAALVAAQKAGTAPALSAAPAAAAAAATVPAASTSGTAAPAASSTSKEVKPPAAGAKKLSATSAAFVFKPNPAAASFTPGASNTTTATANVAAASARRPSATSTAASVAEAAPPPPSKVPVNPFFGTKQIKKGSSSMHVKEDFTPFKNGVPPEPSTVPPAWPFTGKPYRSIYPIPPQGPSLDDAAANGMIDPNNAAAIAAAQQQAHAHAAHAFMGGVAGGVPINILPGPQHPPPPPQQPQAFVAMSSAGGSISGSPASMSMPPPPPPPPPQAITGGGGPHLQHPHPHQQPQPQPQQFGMYGGGNGGHAPPPLAPPHHHQFAQQQQQQQFSPAAAAAVAMGYARQPGGGPAPLQQQQQQQQMAHMNAPGPGPQFQPHGHPPPPPPPFFGQPGGGGGGGPGGGGGGASHMPGFVPGPPHGAQSEYTAFSLSLSLCQRFFRPFSGFGALPQLLTPACFRSTVLSSPHMPHAAVHSPRMSVSTQGGRGPPQQQPPMPWTPPPPPPFQQSATPIPSERATCRFFFAVLRDDGSLISDLSAIDGGPPPPPPHVQGGPGGFPPPQ